MNPSNPNLFARFSNRLVRLGAGAAFFAACLSPLHAELLVKQGESVAFLGDSITAGGWSDAGGYVKLVLDGLQKEGAVVTPYPAGVGGHKSNDMLARLEKDVLSKKPTWMTLSCGVNDVWHGDRGVDLESYKKNITAIVDRAQEAGIKVVLLTATPIFEDVNNAQNKSLANYNDFLRSLAKERKLPLADLNAAFATELGKLPAKPNSRYLTVDGVHMNPEGNVIMAKGCLAAFGVSNPELAKIEKAWLTQPDTAVVSTGNTDLRPRFGITLAQFRGIQKAAVAKGSDFTQYSLTLWLKSLAEVLPRYSSKDVIDGEQVKKDATEVFRTKINTLVKP